MKLLRKIRSWMIKHSYYQSANPANREERREVNKGKKGSR